MIKYKIFDEITEIYLFHKKQKYTVLIDTKNLEKVKDLPLYILMTDTEIEKVYVIFKNFIYLHRFLINAEKGFDVDHINGNSLDNREINLRQVTHAENCRNRIKPTSHNTSGYRNVHKEKDKSNPWKVCIVKDGKQYRKRGFKTVEEANSYAIKLRKELGIE